MTTVDKRIVISVTLPVVAFLVILLDVFKGVPMLRFALILALLLPVPVLIYLNNKEVFGESLAEQTGLSKGTAKTTKKHVVDTKFNTQLRKASVILCLIGSPLVYVAYKIAWNTTRIWYYVLAAVLGLTGTILVGVGVGLRKAAND